MRMDTINDSANVALEQAIERHIDERTWGRVHRLEVAVDDERVCVRGWTTSYYTKQLAIQAVLDILGAKSSCRVDLDIEVGSGDSSQTVSPVYRRFDNE